MNQCEPKNIYYCSVRTDSTPLRLPNICPPALSDSQVVGVYCRQSKERLGGQMFGRRWGVRSVLSLIYVYSLVWTDEFLLFPFNVRNIFHWLKCFLVIDRIDITDWEDSFKLMKFLVLAIQFLLNNWSLIGAIFITAKSFLWTEGFYFTCWIVSFHGKNFPY